MSFSSEDSLPLEGFIERFAEQVDELGFRHSERILPPGMVASPGQTVIRFRRQVNQAPLFQIGDGVFTANGLPPTYTDWSDFAPLIEEGTKAILQSRPPEEEDGPFTSLSLRYLDAFDASFWKGELPAAFISDVLGFKVSTPESVASMLIPSNPMAIATQLRIPLNNGGTLSLQVGEGNANNRPVVMVDMVVQFDNVAISDVHDTFDEAHRVASMVFDDMVAELHNELGGGNK